MRSALAAELPDAEAEARHEQDEEYPEERGRPLIELFGPKADDVAPIGNGEPGDERIAHNARRCVGGQEAAARDAKRSRGKDERGERNGRRQYGGKKDCQDRMTADPGDDAVKQARRYPVFQGGFTALQAQVPRGVSAEDAAYDGAKGEQPGISIVRDEPEKKQIGAAGDGKRDDGGIDDCDGKEAQRAEMNEPV